MMGLQVLHNRDPMSAHYHWI